MIQKYDGVDYNPSNIPYNNQPIYREEYPKGSHFTPGNKFQQNNPDAPNDIHPQLYNNSDIPYSHNNMTMPDNENLPYSQINHYVPPNYPMSQAPVQQVQPIPHYNPHPFEQSQHSQTYPSSMQYNTNLQPNYNPNDFNQGRNSISQPNGYNINPNPQSFNYDMNQIVRSSLISRGMLNPSSAQIKKEEADKKRMLLQNIQQQMSLFKSNKTKELENRRQEDSKYLKDMEVYYPFGRGGGGAPVRDKSGNIVATRKGLISNPRYNHVEINVDDDYYDVWQKDKQFGLMKFINKNQQIMNSNQYQPIPERRYTYSGRNYIQPNNFNQTYPMQPPQFISEQLPRPQTTRDLVQVIQPEYKDLNISYQNYELDGDKKKVEKESYRNELLSQIRDNERRKQEEKERKIREELEEEERIKKEAEKIHAQMLQEKSSQNKYIQNVPEAGIGTNFVIENKKKPYRHHIENSGQSDNQINPNVDHNQQNIQTIPTNNVNIRNDDYQMDYYKELESRNLINNEIIKLRTNIEEQQNLLLKQINDLKAETQNSNLQRYEALKEISSLKEELSQQRADEELRKKYVYDVLIDNNTKVTNTYSKMRLPDIRAEEYQVELPKPKDHHKNAKSFLYDDTIKYPNRVVEIPKLDELDENQIETSTKFIDIDTHNIVDGLNIYEPRKKEEKIDRIKNKAYELDDDFNPLRSYYKENDFHDKVESNLIYNKQTLDEDNVEVNVIYNKNMERLRYLNELEEKITM